MMIIPISWSFRQTEVANVLEVKGECSRKEGEYTMIKNAVALIDKASDFKGIPCLYAPSLSSEALITVSFSLIFPSSKDITSFIASIKDNH